MEPVTGFEPATGSLQNCYATIASHRLMCDLGIVRHVGEVLVQNFILVRVHLVKCNSSYYLCRDCRGLART